MATSLENLTPDIIRAVARKTAVVGAAFSARQTPRGKPSPRHSPRGRQSPRSLASADDRGGPAGFLSDDTYLDELMPALRKASWLDQADSDNYAQQDSDVGSAAFWQACERAHQLYLSTCSAAPSPRGGSLPPSPFSQSPSSGHADSPLATHSPVHRPAAASRSANLGGMQRQQQPSLFEEMALQAQVSVPNVRSVGSSSRTKSQPSASRRPMSASSDHTAKSITVDELVGRLYQAKEKYDQKRHARQQEKDKADGQYSFRPNISSTSRSLASGVESLEARTKKIALKREEKLEKERARKEELAENEIQAQPTITSKGLRLQRGHVARLQWDARKNQKLMQQQRQRINEKLQECTFQPNMCGGSRKIATRHRRESNIFDDEHHVHDRLHDDATRRHLERVSPESVTDFDDRGSDGRAGHMRSEQSTTPRRANKRAPRPASVGAVGSTSGNSDRPLSFEEFMKSLSAQSPDASDTWSSRPAATEDWNSERELEGDSSFVANTVSSRAALGPRLGKGGSRATNGRGTPSTVMSDVQNEVFVGESARPQPSPYPSQALSNRQQQRSRSSPAGHRFEDAALPDWVKFAVPSPAVHSPPADAVPGPLSSSRSKLMQSSHSTAAGWSLSARSAGCPTSTNGSPNAPVFSETGKNSDTNVLTYADTFDDVYRIGYGGALPGTLANLI